MVLVGFLVGVPAAMMAAIGAARPPHHTDRRPAEDVRRGGLGTPGVLPRPVHHRRWRGTRRDLTTNLLRPVAMWNLHRIPIFVSVTTLLCNVVSNVPAVMLLRTLVSGFPDPHTGWLSLAMASTLAGNLTITGSVANITSWWSGPPPRTSTSPVSVW